MSASKYICYFSSHLATFGFWAATQLDNILLNAAGKAGQSLMDFQTAISTAAHATLEMEQLISHMVPLCRIPMERLSQFLKCMI